MKAFAWIRLNGWEALLLAAALGLLGLLAVPFERLAADLPSDGAAASALYHSGMAWFRALALAGWVALLLGRVAWPLVVNAVAVLAWWILYWLWLQPVASPLDAMHGSRGLLTAAALGLVAAAWLLAFALRRSWPSGADWLLWRGPGTALAYPGFVLFAGLGYIWLLDLFAHGHLSGHAVQWNQRSLKLATDVAAAFALVTWMSALAPALLRGLLVAAGALSRWVGGLEVHWRALLAFALSAALCGAIWVFFHLVLRSLPERQVWTPRLVEAVRVPLLLALGYLLYRWLEAGEKLTHSFWLAFGWIGLTALAAFAAFGEKGQTLITFAMLVMLALAVWFEYAARPGSMAQRYAHGLTLLSSLAIFGLVIWLLHTYGGWFGSHIGDRLDAMQHPQQSREDFLAILRWFSAEAGLSGFGLGQVPWCGYAANLGELCSKQTGLPFQIESDYAFFGLVGVWGTLGALAICAALMLWLLALMLTLLPQRRVLLNWSLLQGWLIGLWVVVMLVQVCLTILGGLGQFVLTGVPLPMMATGLASITSIAVFVGLASSQANAYPR